MFRERQNTQVESRVRFKVQDLIDRFEKDWKHEIFYHRRNDVDSDGFQKKYVPKGSKLAQEAQASSAKTTGAAKNGRSRKNSKVKEGDAKPKGASAASQQKQQQAAEGGKGKSMYHLLQSLAPEASEEGKAEES